jgi:hypothetical protein
LIMKLTKKEVPNAKSGWRSYSENDWKEWRV